MSQDYRSDVKRLDALCDASGYKNSPPLKYKYQVKPTAKLGGRKRKTSNSGGVGRVARRKRRAQCVCHAVRRG